MSDQNLLDFPTRIKTIPDDFLDCRDPGIRHLWMLEQHFEISATGPRGVIAELERSARCQRCDTLKVERFDVRRDRVSKRSVHYVYPEGYLLSGVGVTHQRSESIYSERFRRMIETAPLNVVQNRG